jgi:hypothetical protein
VVRPFLCGVLPLLCCFDVVVTSLLGVASLCYAAVCLLRGVHPLLLCVPRPILCVLCGIVCWVRASYSVVGFSWLPYS